MVIVTVDYRYVDRQPRQLARRFEPAKAGANDHD
jgi:hypothetical protein